MFKNVYLFTQYIINNRVSNEGREKLFIMATFEIRKKTVDIWEHNWVDSPDKDLILSSGYFSLTDTKFSLLTKSGGEIRTAQLSEIIVYDDTDVSAPETFTTALDFTTRLKTLNYPYFLEDDSAPTGGVTTSVTLTDNFLVRGNGTSDIDIGNIQMSADGNDLTIPGELNVSSANNDNDAILNLSTTGTNPGAASTFIGSRDPNGNVTGAGGDSYVSDNGVLSGIFFNKSATTSTGWESQSTNPTSVIEITSAAQLEARPEVSGGTFTLTQSTTIDLKSPITSATNINLNGFALTIQGGRRAGNSWTYSGTGDFISSSGVLRAIAIRLVSSSTATLLNITGAGLALTVVAIEDSAIVGWDNLGSVSDGTILLFVTRFQGNTSGFTFTNCNLRFGTLGAFNNSASTPFFTVFSPDVNTLGTIAGIFGTNSTSIMRIDPGVRDGTRMIFSDSAFSGTTFFETTGGATGTFTAVATAAVSATAITSVTDSSGAAQFNFTVGPTLFVHQEVIVSGFVTNTSYNGTFIIVTVAAGSFTVSLVNFGTDETGSFLSDSVTLTDTATTLSDGDTLTIDTDDATDYDGGATVYNQLTNTFQVNRTFTVTKTGTWDTNGIDQTDPKILSFGVSNFVDSKYSACAHVNDNSTVNGAIVNNTFTDMVFGTVGSALIESSTIERWKLIDEINGTFEYFGNEPFDGQITFDFTVQSSGGTVDFRFKWQISTDGGSSFIDLTDNVESLVSVGSDDQSVTKTFPLALETGAQIKPQITRNSASSGITTTYATIYATQ